MRIVIELRRAAAATRPRPRRIGLLACALFALMVAGPPAGRAAELSVTRDPSGLGMVLPGGLWLSGDLTVTATVPDGNPAELELDDVGLLARWEPTSRLALFGEMRVESLPTLVEAEGFDAGTGDVSVERLYAELLITPRLTLRVGKTFTPFGLWNVIRRAPLTWTVEEPAVAEGVFPRRATGLSVLYQTTWQGWSFDATAYGPAQDELAFRSNPESGLLFGGRMAVGRDAGPAFVSVGLNAAGFRSYDRSAWTTSTGLDLEVAVHGHAVSAEFTYREPTDDRARHGLYLQDAFPLVRDLFGVVRFEYFQPRHGPAAVGGLLGAFWRPSPHVIVKADYLFGSRDLDNFEPGFHASFSFLF